MSMLLAKTAVVTLAGTYVESNYLPSNTDGPAGLSTLFGVTPGILGVMSFWIVSHGMKVGQARNKYMELAKKDGEANVDERYGLPNLYAQGTSKHVLAFNCVQRSHQHILETFTSAALCGMVGAIHFPVTAAVSTLAYFIGRMKLSEGYAAAEGDASKRYSSPLARFKWYGLLGNMILCLLSSVNIVAGKKILW